MTASEPVAISLGHTRDHETILLVEDSDGVRDAVAEFLTSAGYTVLSASNSAEAIEIAKQQAQGIDVLLTDLAQSFSRGRPLASLNAS